MGFDCDWYSLNVILDNYRRASHGKSNHLSLKEIIIEIYFCYKHKTVVKMFASYQTEVLTNAEVTDVKSVSLL